MSRLFRGFSFSISPSNEYSGLDPEYTNNPEKAVAPHSGTLAWRIPRPEEPGGLQSMGSPRVEHG